MASPSFVTLATNFASGASNGVDLRTGSYNISIPLGHLIGNGGLGPIVPLTLRYSPLTAVNFGFGKGFSLGFSVYQTTTDGAVLNVSTGEQYGVYDDAGNDVLQVLQQRLPSFNFVRTTGGYNIVHKNGDIEILGADVVCTPTRIISAAGHGLKLTWDNSDTAQLIKSVTDDDGTVLLQATPSDTSMELQILPSDTQQGYTLTFSLDDDLGDNGMLQTLTLTPSADSDLAQTWTFTASDIGVDDGSGPYWGRWITGVTSPGGLAEVVTYTDGINDGFTFPDGAPFGQNLWPYVNEYTRTPTPSATQSVITSDYQFSGTGSGGGNYLGAGSDLNWQQYLDSLASMPYDSSYNYWGQETLKSTTSNSVVTKRTYNSYHLESVEERTCNVSIRTTSTAYGSIVDGGVLDNPSDGQTLQPAQYQLQTSQGVYWNDASTTETTQHTWDEFGNPLTRQTPDGVLTQWKYYDAKGETGCPPDPNGFKRFPKWMRTDPTKYTPGKTDAPVQQISYQYDSFKPASFNQDVVAAMVLKTSEAHYSGGTISASGDLPTGAVQLAGIQFKYYEGTGGAGGHLDDRGAGRIYNRQFKHYPNGADKTAWESNATYAYADVKANSNGTLGVSTTITNSDSDTDPDTLQPVTLTTTEITVISANTGRQWEHTDVLQNVTTWQYDGLGRLTQRTLNSTDDDYSNVFTYWNYVGADDQTKQNYGTCAFQTIMQDQKKNTTCYTMDGLGRILYKDANCPDSSDSYDQSGLPTVWFNMESRTYNDMGRVATATTKDHLSDGSWSGALTKTITYDDWGNASIVAYSDGVIETTAIDPTKKTVSTVTSSTQTSIQNKIFPSGKNVTTYDYNLTQHPVKLERYSVSPTGDFQLYTTHTKIYDGLYLLRSETMPVGGVSTSDAFAGTSAYTYDAWSRLGDTTISAGSNTVTVHRDYSEKSPGKYVAGISISKRSVGTRVFDMLGRVRWKTVGNATWKHYYTSAAHSRPDYVITPDNFRCDYTYSYQLQELVTSVSARVNTDGSPPLLTQSYTYDKQFGILNDDGSSQNSRSFTSTYDAFPSGRLKQEHLQHFGDSAQTASYTYTVGGQLATYKGIDGSTQTITRDDFGRVKTVSDGTVSVAPQYDDKGWLVGWSATRASDQSTFNTALALDSFGREITRTVTDSGTSAKWTVTQQWYSSDLLKMRFDSPQGSRGKYDAYEYDYRNRLLTWDTTRMDNNAPPFVVDQNGNSIRSQNFTLDDFGNCTSVALGYVTKSGVTGTNTTTYNYTDPNDPCRLVSGSNSVLGPASFTIEYDGGVAQGPGRITNDGMGTTFQYDALGRVQHAASTTTNLAADYGYDARSRLAWQSRTEVDTPLQFYYRANELINLVQGSISTKLFRSPSGAPVASADGNGVSMLRTDMLGSVLSVSDGKTTPVPAVAYMPYGDQGAGSQ